MIKNLSWLLWATLVLSACGAESGDAIPLPGIPAEQIAKPLPAGLYEAVVAQGVSPVATALAFDRYERFRHLVTNDNFVSIIDFTKHSGEARLYVVEVATGAVEAIHVAHGSKSDPNDDGLATAFSNVPNSKKTSLGAYLISEKYYGKYGASMRTDGLEPTNDLARRRTIVLHPSSYVSSTRSKQGRSWGCPAVPFAWITKLIARLRDGSFMYAYSDASASVVQVQMELQRLLIDPSFRWLDESAAPVDGE